MPKDTSDICSCPDQYGRATITTSSQVTVEANWIQSIPFRVPTIYHRFDKVALSPGRIATAEFFCENAFYERQHSNRCYWIWIGRAHLSHRGDRGHSRARPGLHRAA